MLHNLIFMMKPSVKKEGTKATDKSSQTDKGISRTETRYKCCLFALPCKKGFKKINNRSDHEVSDDAADPHDGYNKAYGCIAAFSVAPGQKGHDRRINRRYAGTGESK